MLYAIKELSDKLNNIEWNMRLVTLALAASLALTGCSSWVYKYDITQGNYLDQDDVDKLRKGMTKEQVEFVLGKSLLRSAFSSDTWRYVHTLKSGKTDKTARREVVVNFIGDKLESVEGDLKVPVDFNKSLDET